MHSTYAGVGSGVILGVCAGLSVGGTRKLYMIGVHLGLLFQLLLAVVFLIQSYRSYGVPEKADRYPLVCVPFLTWPIHRCVIDGCPRVWTVRRHGARFCCFPPGDDSVQTQIEEED